MHHNGVLCFRCVQPFALNYRCYNSMPPYDLHRRRSCAGPPANMRGEVADRDLDCSRCRSIIPKGRGYVRLRRHSRVETRDASTALSSSGLETKVVPSRDTEALSWHERMRVTCTTILGLVLAVSPLALWLAPTIMAFVVILGVTLSAVVLLCLLEFAGGRGTLQQRLRQSPAAPRLPDGFLAEMLNLLPNSHHNRLPGDREYHRKTVRLRQLLRGSTTGRP